MGKKNMNKSERKTRALMHISDMDARFREETERSVATCRVLRGSMLSSGPNLLSRFEKTEVEIIDADSVSAVMSYSDQKVLLDFASYFNPGGGYENGAWFAQEEMICGESNLYNILNEERAPYYSHHKENFNKGLYTSDALYVRDVVFERDGDNRRCDVVVMAAPNAKTARQHDVSEDEITGVLEDRVRCAMTAACEDYANIAIMGAFGCGVFGNAPIVVAKTYKKWIEDHPGMFKKVVFAIPHSSKTDNLEIFESVFEDFTSKN